MKLDLGLLLASSLGPLVAASSSGPIVHLDYSPYHGYYNTSVNTTLSPTLAYVSRIGLVLYTYYLSTYI